MCSFAESAAAAGACCAAARPRPEPQRRRSRAPGTNSEALVSVREALLSSALERSLSGVEPFCLLCESLLSCAVQRDLVRVSLELFQASPNQLEPHTRQGLIKMLLSDPVSWQRIWEPPLVGHVGWQRTCVVPGRFCRAQCLE